MTIKVNTKYKKVKTNKFKTDKQDMIELAKDVVKLKRIVAKDAPEMKHFLNSTNNIALASNVWTKYILTDGLIQGVTENDRIGNSIFVHSLYIDVYSEDTRLQTNAIDHYNPMRYLVIQENGPGTTASAPLNADVFSQQLVTGSFVDIYNPSDYRRFRLLKDAMFMQTSFMQNIATLGSIVSSVPPMFRRYTFKINKQVDFVDKTINSVRNKIYFWVTTSIAGDVATAPFRMAWKLNYTDI